MYCLCVNVSRTTATGCQTNRSYQIYHIISNSALQNFPTYYWSYKKLSTFSFRIQWDLKSDAEKILRSITISFSRTNQKASCNSSSFLVVASRKDFRSHNFFLKELWKVLTGTANPLRHTHTADVITERDRNRKISSKALRLGKGNVSKPPFFK